MNIKIRIMDTGKTRQFNLFEIERGEIDPPLSDDEIIARKHENRVIKIIKDESLNVTPATLKRYLDYLRKRVRLPLIVTGIENDFIYSDYGDKTPGGDERFEVVEFIDDVENCSNLFVKVKIENTNKEYELQLYEFKPLDSPVEITKIFEDYTEWIETCL